MARFKKLVRRYESFIESRGWSKFHTPKNVASAISVEANELLELFLWHSDLDADRIKQDEELVDAIQSEVADVVIYCMSLSIYLDFDLLTALEEKLEENEERFDNEQSAKLTKQLEEYRE